MLISTVYVKKGGTNDSRYGIELKKTYYSESDHPELSGDGRTGGFQNSFKINGFEFEFCHDP